MTRHRQRIPVLLGSLFMTPALYAAHPLITEDTATQGQGNLQFELTNEQTVTHEVGTDRTTVLTNGVLTFGATDSADVIVTVPYLRLGASPPAGTPAESGFTDAGLDLKWRFYDTDRLSFALKPGLTFPTGDETRNLGTGRVTWSAYLTTSYRTGRWNALLHVGHVHHNNTFNERRDIWHGSAALVRQLGESLQVVVDTGVDTSTDRRARSNPTFLITGLIWSARKNLDVDLGYRLESSDTLRARALLAGLAARW
jgi:hypothetical protein